MKKVVLGLLLFVGVLGITKTVQAEDQEVYTLDEIYSDNEVSQASPMFRVYNPNSGEHFYTKELKERDQLVQVGWKNEGVGWLAPPQGVVVHRLYNKNAGDHHYTTSLSETKQLVAAGWKDEGTGWYSDMKKRVPLHRAYNKNAKAGSHNYTTSMVEQNALVKAGWKDEGISWYGVDANIASVVEADAEIAKIVQGTDIFMTTFDKNHENDKTFLYYNYKTNVYVASFTLNDKPDDKKVSEMSEKVVNRFISYNDKFGYKGARTDEFFVYQFYKMK